VLVSPISLPLNARRSQHRRRHKFGQVSVTGCDRSYTRNTLTFEGFIEATATTIKSSQISWWYDCESKEDWLAWLCDILVDIPVQPLNSRGKPKQKHRGQGKATRLNRAAFVAKLPSGYTRKEQDLFWRDYKKQ
jgi:hypothetical protein